MKKLIVADYIGNSSKDKKPSGHLVKLLREINELLKNDFDISYIVADNYAEFSTEIKITAMVKHLDNTKSRINRVMQRYKNLSTIFKQEFPIWFINVDFWFYFYVAFSRHKANDIYVLNYCSYKHQRGSYIQNLKWWIYQKANKKIKKEFVTNRHLYMDNQVYVPDYYFNPQIYEKYNRTKKKNQVVFCGGISRAKEVEHLVDVFIKNRQPLIISGKFESEELFKTVRAKATDNIQIFNRRLSDFEYYSLIGESKYTILPYKKSCYSGRSSGVILEALFLDSVVIAPEFLLKELDIKGITYENLDNLQNLDLSIQEHYCNELLANNELVKKKYSIQQVKKIYCSALKD